MHYYADNQNREHRLTHDICRFNLWAIAGILKLGPHDKIICELDKQRYGAIGDVDIAAWKNPGQMHEAIIGVEVKVIHLDKTGEFKSKKEFKHNKQLNNLVKEGWDYVYFFDFIVVEPSESWFHEQSFDGFEKYTKEVNCQSCGHAIFQVNSVAHKPEVQAGSISAILLKEAMRNLNNSGRGKILEALRLGYA